MKLFFWQDQSGRGYSNIFTLEQVKALDLEVGTGHYTLQEAGDWAAEAKQGDDWNCHANSLLCIQDDYDESLLNQAALKELIVAALGPKKVWERNDALEAIMDYHKKLIHT